jgi:hypothetical protein
MNSLYNRAYKNSLGRHGDSFLAHKVATAILRKAYDEGTQVLQFALEEAETQIISNSQGDIELTVLLANKNPRKTDGKWFSDEALETLAAQINSEGSTLPDVDHKILNMAKAKYGSDVEAIANAVKQEKGVFKSIKAAVKDGKLWIHAVLDRAYQAVADKFRKVSIEAVGKVDRVTGMISQPRYLGFTFTHTPELDGVGVAS